MLYTYYLLHCLWIAEYQRLAWHSHDFWSHGYLDASIKLDGEIALVLQKAGRALAFAFPKLELPMWAQSLDEAFESYEPYYGRAQEIADLALASYYDEIARQCC